MRDKRPPITIVGSLPPVRVIPEGERKIVYFYPARYMNGHPMGGGAYWVRPRGVSGG